jgi:hypothetical protein
MNKILCSTLIILAASATLASEVRCSTLYGHTRNAEKEIKKLAEGNKITSVTMVQAEIGSRDTTLCVVSEVVPKVVPSDSEEDSSQEDER